MPEKLLTAREVKEQFGLSRGTLLRYEEQGRIKPARTPGSQRRYASEDLQGLFVKPSDPIVTQKPTFDEFGVSGLRKWGGAVFEERLAELRGRRGRILLREMHLNDPVIAAIFFAFDSTLREASWRVKPASEAPGDIEAAKFLEECIHDMEFSWNDTLSFIIEPMMEQGFSLLEFTYKRRLGDNPPGYVENPALSLYADGRVGWRKWGPRPAESLADRNEWVFDSGGNVIAINQMPEADGVWRVIPMDKCILFRTTVNPANTPEGRPIHRSAYVSYVYTKNMQEVEGIGIERDLNGIPVIYLGRDCTLQGDNSDFNLAQDLVRNIRQDEQAGVVIPHSKMGHGATEGEGMLIELLSSTGQRAHDVSKIIERYDKRKALSCLSQFIMLGMDRVGSFALSKSQSDLFSIAVTAWINNIADTINRVAVPKLFRYNAFVGMTALPRVVPSAAGLGSDLEAVSKYIDIFIQNGVLTPDAELERHVRQLARLPDSVMRGGEESSDPSDIDVMTGDNIIPEEERPGNPQRRAHKATVANPAQQNSLRTTAYNYNTLTSPPPKNLNKPPSNLSPIGIPGTNAPVGTNAGPK